MSNKPSFDASEISSGAEARAWQANSIRKAVEYDAYGAKTVFSVRVLTRPITLSGEEYRAIMGDGTMAGMPPEKNYSRIMFKGRITSAGGVPSPHLTLPDPCSLTDTLTPDAAQCAARIISMHTTFFSNMDHNGATPEIGDLVRGQLDPGDTGKFNLQFASFTAMETIATSARGLSCRSSLVSIFNTSAGNASPAQMNANNPMGRAIGDDVHDPVRPWSNRAQQRIVKWNSTAYTQIPNGTVIANGDKALSPAGTYLNIGGTAELLAAAVPDWNKLKDAYAKKFPGKTLTANGAAAYRSYQGQVTVRLQRHDSNDVFRGGCLTKKGVSSHTNLAGTAKTKCSLAATPGTSNHGFGAAVDINRAASGWDDPDGTSGEQFKWINRWARNFNFILGVPSENWHIDWVPFRDQVDVVQGTPLSRPTNVWASELPNRPAVTLV